MFTDEVKYYLLKICITEVTVSNFLILRFIFDHIFGSEKDKLIFPVFF